MPGFCNYEVSSHGAVRSMDRTETLPWGKRRRRGKPLKLRRVRGGYLGVTILKAGKAHAFIVGRLVLSAFCRPPEAGEQVCHYPDRDRANNRVGNLRWGTAADNAADRELHGTVARGRRSGAYTHPEKVKMGETHYNFRLSADVLQKIIRMRLDGDSQQSIADATGYSQAYVSKILAKHAAQA